MTPQDIRTRAADQVAKAKPQATLHEVRTEATVLAAAFERWLIEGDKPAPPATPGTPTPPPAPA